MPNLMPQASKTLVIAHRGARAYAPENTLPAFKKAYELGCGMIELDVRMTKDKVLVVHHDETLERCTDVAKQFPERTKKKLWEFDYEELSRLDAGSWFVRELELPPEKRQPFLQTLTDTEIQDFISQEDWTFYTSGQVKIPTLAESLELAKKLGLQVNIEIKEQPDDFMRFVSSIVIEVNTLDMQPMVRISSFNLGLLECAKFYSDSISIAMLANAPISAPITSLRKLGANAYHPGIFQGYKIDKAKGLTRRYLNHLQQIRQSGFVIAIWTCNDPRDIAELLAVGVDGIISDYPNRVQAVMQSL